MNTNKDKNKYLISHLKAHSIIIMKNNRNL